MLKWRPYKKFHRFYTCDRVSRLLRKFYLSRREVFLYHNFMSLTVASFVSCENLDGGFGCTLCGEFHKKIYIIVCNIPSISYPPTTSPAPTTTPVPPFFLPVDPPPVLPKPVPWTSAIPSTVSFIICPSFVSLNCS